MTAEPGRQDEDKRKERALGAFEALVEDAPHLEDLTSGNRIILLGLLLNSREEGKFLLAMPGGRTLQLSRDRVLSYRVVEQNGSQRLVQIEIAADDLPHSALLILAQLGCACPPPPKRVAYDEVTPALAPDYVSPMPGTTYPHWDKAPLIVGQGGQTMHTIQDIVANNPITPNASESGGTTPFVMATPHHAPQAIALEQGMADLEGG